MGWGERVARSHASRLERQGWLARCPMTRGHGSLLVATKRGVLMSGLSVSAASEPAPTWWAHDCACAWTAAWLTVRGRDWRGPREVRADPDLTGELPWQTGTGWRRSGHRPHLAVLIPDGRVVIEVELQRKATNRLQAVLSLYRRWLAEERIVGVIYVCGDQAGGRESACRAGLPDQRLRIELLTTAGRKRPPPKTTQETPCPGAVPMRPRGLEPPRTNQSTRPSTGIRARRWVQERLNRPNCVIVWTRWTYWTAWMLSPMLSAGGCDRTQRDVGWVQSSRLGFESHNHPFEIPRLHAFPR
jgi:hypothetical protein